MTENVPLLSFLLFIFLYSDIKNMSDRPHTICNDITKINKNNEEINRLAESNQNNLNRH